MKWEEIVKYAKSDVGKSRDEVGCPGTYAWCAAYVSSVLNRAGIGDDVADTSCTLMQKKMSENENWSEPDDCPKAGDIIFFDWDHDTSEQRPLDHVGICTRFDNTTFDIIYVNGNGSSPHYVTEQVLNLYAKNSQGNNLVAYWMRYAGDQAEPEAEEDEPETEETENPDEDPEEKELILKVRQLKRGMKGGDVKALQRLLFADGYSVGVCGDDGEFGPDTENAVINYQESHDLNPHGIADEETLTSLWNSRPFKRSED